MSEYTGAIQRVSIIDSHTGGEPTRVVVAGYPDLGSGSAADRCREFAEKHDAFRRAVVNEPRGSGVLVGALLLPPSVPECIAAVVFFNNVGCLGMCGHGTIGLLATMAHLGRISPGVHRIETPVGIVSARLHENGKVSLENVASFRKEKNLQVSVPGYGVVTGDVAWGGNWFFLVEKHAKVLHVSHAAELTVFCEAIRRAVHAAGFPEVDHVELFGPAHNPDNHSRNFVLCPGSAYDRSPCGTGTSAKLACLAADGKLAPGQVWRQESIVGSVFEGTVNERDGQYFPAITGQAWVTAVADLWLDPSDPFCFGFPHLPNS